VCCLLQPLRRYILLAQLNHPLRHRAAGDRVAGVQTTLESAHLSILGGKLDLRIFRSARRRISPRPKIFTLGGITVPFIMGNSPARPFIFEQIGHRPSGSGVEQSNLQLNLNALLHQMPQSPKTSGGQETQPIKLVIDELDLNDAQVTFMPGIPGLANPFRCP
jgi:hypothetical protein